MIGGFEIHITLSVADCGVAIACMSSMNMTDGMRGWTYSQIDADPDMGPGVRAYLTNHSATYYGATAKLESMWSLIKSRGVDPQRKKIELIMLDERAK